MTPDRLSGVVAIADAVAIGLPSVVVYVGYVGWNPESLPRYLLVTVLNVVLTVAILRSNGLYAHERIIAPLRQTHKIVGACAVAFLLLAAMGFMLKVSAQYSRVWAVCSVTSGTLLICAMRLCLYRLVREWAHAGRVLQRIAIVGATAQARRLIEKLERQRERRPWIRVAGVYADREERTRCEQGVPRVVGNLDNLLGDARNGRIDAVLLAIPWSAEKRLLAILGKLSILPVDIRLAPDLIGHRFAGKTYERIGEMAYMSLYENPTRKWSHAVKEVGDVAIASIALLLVLPLMAVIAAAIKLESRGPAVFRQARSGFNNEQFEIFKFRTMHVEGAGEDALDARRNGRGVTRVGSFLRRTSLDELPQLLNVLTGKMSLVGPRPHWVEVDKLHIGTLPGYLSRNRMKPGITGWAQVNGLRGGVHADAEWNKVRIDHDIYYIEHWSLLFDLQILAMTPYAVVKHALSKQRND